MAMSSSSSAAETSTMWGMFNRKNRLASQEEQEPFQEVVGRPSAAFYESMRIAKQRSQGSDAARQWSMEDDEDRDNRGKKVGTKTLLAACFFVIVGLTLFIVGMAVYFKSTKDDPHNGLEMLVIGIIMLVPGSYAATILYGVFKGWRGYKLDQLPSLDE